MDRGVLWLIVRGEYPLSLQLIRIEFKMKFVLELYPKRLQCLFWRTLFSGVPELSKQCFFFLIATNLDIIYIGIHPATCLSLR